MLERWLFLYSMDARRLWNSDNVAGLEELQGTFRRAMRCYDEHIKEKPTELEHRQVLKSGHRRKNGRKYIR